MTTRSASDESSGAPLPATDAAAPPSSAFLDSLSAELRTTLNSMLGFAQLSLRDTRDLLPERHRLRIAHVVAGGEHLLRILDDAVLLSRIESGSLAFTPEPADLAKLICDAMAALEPLATSAGISLQRLALPEVGLPVTVDRERLLLLLLKYGTNAINCNREGGSVSFGFSVAAGRVRIAVVDTGPGIPEHSRARLFEPFVTDGLQGAAVGGTRLGLAIAKGLARHMGGSVGYRDVRSGGSELWVELPLQGCSSRSGLRVAVSVDRDEPDSVPDADPDEVDPTPL